MRLSTREMEYIRNNLMASRAYRDSEIPCNGACIWKPFMEHLLKKITDELEVQS